MKIENITLREIQMPLVHFFETSFGRVYSRRILLLTARCEGIDGWAECVAGEDPYYSSEWIETAWSTLKHYLAPAVMGRPLAAAHETAALMAKVRGHRMAKAAIENAAWDAEARQKGQPLWQLLGGTTREIQCGVSIGIQDSVEQLLAKIETELAAGYRRIKVKVKPGWDVDVLERIRARWPDILLSCDANSAYTLDEVEHLRKFDRFNLLMIEQPLWNDDIYYHRKCQSRPGGGLQRGQKSARRLPGQQCSGMVWRHAGIGRGTSSQHRAVHAAKFPSAWRRVRVEALLEGRHHRARSRSQRPGHNHALRPARHRLPHP
jgi:O-succinylbenzoate synthase